MGNFLFFIGCFLVICFLLIIAMITFNSNYKCKTTLLYVLNYQRFLYNNEEYIKVFNDFEVVDTGLYKCVKCKDGKSIYLERECEVYI